jgi:hypothetical protein
MGLAGGHRCHRFCGGAWAERALKHGVRTLLQRTMFMHAGPRVLRCGARPVAPGA